MKMMMMVRELWGFSVLTESLLERMLSCTKVPCKYFACFEFLIVAGLQTARKTFLWAISFLCEHNKYPSSCVSSTFGELERKTIMDNTKTASFLQFLPSSIRQRKTAQSHPKSVSTIGRVRQYPDPQRLLNVKKIILPSHIQSISLLGLLWADNLNTIVSLATILLWAAFLSLKELAVIKFTLTARNFLSFFSCFFSLISAGIIFSPQTNSWKDEKNGTGFLKQHENCPIIKGIKKNFIEKGRGFIVFTPQL